MAFTKRTVIIAGCDEAGRGCLAGPVFAASVILPDGFRAEGLNDSKKVTRKVREKLRNIIIKEAVAWKVASCDVNEIDTLNILWASVKAMHKAIDGLEVVPDLLQIDGNRFKPYKNIPHECIVGGDGLMDCISAASILAKTYRDDYMEALSVEYPQYDWINNKGYGTAKHLEAIRQYGCTPFHRMSFKPISQLQMEFPQSEEV